MKSDDATDRYLHATIDQLAANLQAEIDAEIIETFVLEFGNKYAPLIKHPLSEVLARLIEIDNALASIERKNKVLLTKLEDTLADLELERSRFKLRSPIERALEPQVQVPHVLEIITDRSDHENLDL